MRIKKGGADIVFNEENKNRDLSVKNEDLENKIDEYSSIFYKAFTIIDSEHEFIHRGAGYKVFNFFTLGGNSVGYFQLKTGSKYVHLKQRSLIDGTNTIKCSFYENPTTITDGTIEITSLNRNRNSSNVRLTKFYSNPSAITGGLLLDIDYLPGTNQASTSEKVSGLEYVLKPNTNYYFKIENMSSGNADILSKCFFYEL